MIWEIERLAIAIICLQLFFENNKLQDIDVLTEKINVFQVFIMYILTCFSVQSYDSALKNAMEMTVLFQESPGFDSELIFLKFPMNSICDDCGCPESGSLDVLLEKIKMLFDNLRKNLIFYSESPTSLITFVRGIFR